MVRLTLIPKGVRTQPPATAEQIAAVAKRLGRSVPLPLSELWATSDGLASPEGAVVYSTEDLPERNETLEVEKYAPGYVAVGDDGGGRALLMVSSGDSAVWVDMGSMDPSTGVELTPPWLEWLEAGLPLQDAEAEREEPTHVDVYLEKKPEGGLRTLVLINKVLALDLGAKELLAAANQAPARLQRAAPFGKSLVRARKINAVEDCVRLRFVDSPRYVVDEHEREH